ncbi:MAG: type I restriction enzyme HsdR N-terminal domain-containing protein [Ekhidna sp.]
MQALKLPEFDIIVKDHSVFCMVRKKWVVLTPEEWVRQHFINLLVNHLGYPKGMMKLEHSMTYFKNLKRSDITVMDKDSGIFMLVECKAATVPIDQKTVNQIGEYNKVLNARYLVVTNGLRHFLWEKEDQVFVQIQNFPSFS